MKWFVEGQYRGRVIDKSSHHSKGSAQIEVAAMIERIKRGEIDAIYVMATDRSPARKITYADLWKVERAWGGNA